MKRWCCLLLLALAAAGLAACASQSPRFAAAPPPPSIDAPGVAPTVAASTASAPVASVPTLPLARDANGNPPPTVTVRKEDGATIQEYRHSGQIYMIRITPEHGVTQTYIDSNGDGQLDPDPGQGPIAPVYYTLYEWD